MYQALYRKWRPRTFDDVVGQGHITGTLKRQVATGIRLAGARAAVNELDIRGLMTGEADLAVDQFLDNAVMGKLNVVTIIHGKGTGALRKAVHQQLKRHPSVKGFRLGRYGEGEDGVTVVELRQ